LKIIQRFGKNCNCHLKEEFCNGGRFWQTYTRKTTEGELNLMVALFGAEQSALNSATKTHEQVFLHVTNK
jgi:hypothetical protein